MRAVYYEAFQRLPILTSLPDPTPAPNGVVIGVRATGLCRSDWHGWMGHDGDITPPHVPGHEFAGEIVAVGAEVRRWTPGDRVTAPFCLGCGTCPQCRSGQHQVCGRYEQPGFTYWGSFAEFVAVPYAETNLVALPESMAYRQAALLGCRYTTAFRAVVQQGRLRPGEWVVVFGCGGVGLSALQIARAAGARTIGIDIHPSKLQWAARLGADHTIDAAATKDVPVAVRERTDGGAHLAIDAFGSPDTCRGSILSLRRQGRHVQVGLLGGHADPPLPVSRIIAYELEMIGSHGLAAHAFPRLFDLIGDWKLDPEALLGNIIPLEGAPEALARFEGSAQPGVTVIEVGG